MKIKIDLEDNFIDVWNEEREIWERYVKIELVEEKKIPEKLLGEPRHIYNENELYIVGKINEIIDYLQYLKSKGE